MGKYPLQYALKYNKLDMVKYLLYYRANPLGWGCKNLICETNNPRIYRKLLTIAC